MTSELYSAYINQENPDHSKIKSKCALSEVKNMGLNKFINKHNIFSYAITSQKIFSYTTFGDSKKRVINA